MKLTKHLKRATGISLLISAVTLTASFVVLACKKRSLLAALMVLATAEGVAGAALLYDAEGRSGENAFERLKKAKWRKFSHDDELFVGEEADEAHHKLRRELCGEQGGVCVRARKRVRKEILRDEDATEADFQ